MTYTLYYTEERQKALDSIKTDNKTDYEIQQQVDFINDFYDSCLNQVKDSINGLSNIKVNWFINGIDINIYISIYNRNKRKVKEMNKKAIQIIILIIVTIPLYMYFNLVLDDYGILCDDLC